MKKLVLIGLVVGVMASLSGCAGLQQVNDSLANMHGAISRAETQSMQQSLQVGSGVGYSPTIMVTVPANVCDRAAFMDGARAGYATNWNMTAGEQANIFRMQARSSHSAAAKQNAALWANKQIAASADVYQPQADINATICHSTSYQEGYVQGQAASAKDVQAFQAREVH